MQRTFAMVSFLLALLAVLAYPTHAQTPTGTPLPCIGKYPFEASVVGKEESAWGGCSPGGGRTSTLLKIYKWGLYYSPEFHYSQRCREEIVVSYTKSSQPAMIYYRPLTGAKFFQKSHPNLFKKHQNDEHVEFPCHKVPVQNVHVWKNRALFVSLVKKAIKGVEYIRNLDCSAPEHYGNPNDKFNWTQLREKIAKDRVPTAAVNFLHTVAYSNFFCA